MSDIVFIDVVVTEQEPLITRVMNWVFAFLGVALLFFMFVWGISEIAKLSEPTPIEAVCDQNWPLPPPPPYPGDDWENSVLVDPNDPDDVYVVDNGDVECPCDPPIGPPSLLMHEINIVAVETDGEIEHLINWSTDGHCYGDGIIDSVEITDAAVELLKMREPCCE